MSVVEGARTPEDFLQRARDATASARLAPSLSDAEAMIRVARIWLDLAGDAMSGLLAAELSAAAANDWR